MGGGGPPHAGAWLLALLDEDRSAAEEAATGADLDGLAAGARQGDDVGELSRVELESHASRRAAEVGHGVVAPADVAFAILAAQTTGPASREPPAVPAPAEPVPPAGEAPDLPLSFAAESFLESSVRDHADRGERIARGEVAREAARRAHREGRDVVAEGDVQAAIAEAVGRAAAPPAGEEPAIPEPEPEPEPAPPEPATPAPAPPHEAEEPAPEADRRGEPERPARPPIFRLFVSSTFEDLEEERNALVQRVYPKLRALCAEHGASFQPIDLRWGVSGEASLDQQAMNICLGEIERCRKVTPRPNFLVLLGNRYGWRPPPPQIPAAEFERILGRTTDPDKRKLLEKWYRLDENAVPPEYHLEPREKDGPYAKWEDWEPEEGRLHAVLVEAVKGTDLAKDPRYGASATEQEIVAGALGIGAPEGHAFCFVREIDVGEGDPDPEKADEKDPIHRFVDADPVRIAGLKGRIESELPLKASKADWDGDRDAPTTDHLEDFADDVLAALEGAIRKQLDDPFERPDAEERETRIEDDEHLDGEGEAHREFADERIRRFVGRDDLLGAVDDYVGASDPFPLVLHGEGGTGKSALLAEALRRAQGDGNTQLVYRFIGATPGSSDGRGLLEGICRELARRYGADEAEVPSDYQELSADFRQRLELARQDRPLILLVDSLDQLTTSHGARRLAWIPQPLPEHVRLVVSTRPGDTKDGLAERLERAEQREARLVEVGPMSRPEGKALLEHWLGDEGRKLIREDQRNAVLDAFEASKGNPLYLRLAFEEARRWTGDQDPEELAEGVKGIIEQNTFARLAHEENHGKVLVSHALGYLAASRYGLAEDELLDLLSRDPEVYRWFVLGSYHVPLDLRERLEDELGDRVDDVARWLGEIRAEERDVAELDAVLAEVLPRRDEDSLRLPVVLWSRLYADLRPYLTERAFEDSILIGFYHRELEEVAGEGKLDDGDVDYHGRLADYFRPGRDGEGRPEWGDASLHGLSEVPYHLALGGEEHWDELHDTLTDFRFLEEKAQRVGKVTVRDADGKDVTTYTGVQLLQDDFDLSLREMGGGEEAGRPRIIVTVTDLGDGYVVRCPHCNVVHAFTEECTACDARHKVADWKGSEMPCPNPSCNGPLKVNDFVVERRTWG